MNSVLFDTRFFEFQELLKSKNVRTLFQPIVSLVDGSVLGYEALSRGPVQSSFESAESLFAAGRGFKKSWELEQLCRQRAIERFRDLSVSCKLFLNVDPNVIQDESFKRGFTHKLLNSYGVDPSAIVFELTEGTSVVDFDILKDAVAHYLKQGYKIAVDDLGEGYSGLKVLSETHPNFMKIDMSLIRSIEKKPINQALIKTFCEFGRLMNIKVVAEGIETTDELRTLVELGVEYGQGYLIARPEEQFQNPGAGFLKELDDIRSTIDRLKTKKANDVLVGEVTRFDTPVDSLVPSKLVFKLFTENRHLMGIPVTDEIGAPVGLVMRERFFGMLATQFGTAVYMKRPIHLLMKKDPVYVDYYTTVTEAAEIALGRRDEDAYDYLIVTRNGRYYGVLTIRDLLERLLEKEC